MESITHLGDFALAEILGEGGFGTVYRAEQRSLERDAVVKVMRRSLAVNPDAGERFIREAKLASRFDHPYAAHVYAFGAEADGLLWIAMERVRGTPLSQLGALAPARLLPLFERLCEVVQAAHDQGIVHRDIKPANVMVLERAGRLLPKLLDFGIASTLDAPADGPLGTPAYMAPEQWRGEAGPATDQYALALVAYESLTGTRAIAGETNAQLRDRHFARLPRHPDLPLPVYAVLVRASAVDAANRYANLHDFAAALRTAIAPDQLDEALAIPDEIAAWAADAPRPIADAMVAILLARSPIRIADRVGDAATTLARWLGVLALACRSSQGALDAEAVRALRRRALRDEEWLAFADGIDAPLPLAGGAAALGPLLADSDAPATERLVCLATALGALDWLLDQEVTAGRELWMGPSGEPPVMGAHGDDDPRIVVRDADGAPLIALTPLAQILEGAMHLLAGPGRAPETARMVVLPRGREREVDDVWPWLGRALGADEEARSPYPGLTAFTGEDHASFVGREQEIDSVVDRLRTEPLVAIVGASGVGKSSFLVAGVAPALPWRAVVVRPGNGPIALGTLDDVCVIVDQGEELFTMCSDPAARAAFVEQLRGARVAIAVRDDFFVRVDELFGGRLARSLHVLRVPGEDVLARMVEVPATLRGYAFEDPRLPRQIAREVAGQPGALPLLAFACAELWQRRDRHFHRIPRAAYAAIGGVTGALIQHADGVVDALPTAEQRAVRLAFRRLIAPDGTRALVATADLDARIVEKLLAARLIAMRDDIHVELAHEALVGAWPRLARWRREDDVDARLHARLTAAAKHWDERARDAGLLWRGEALASLHAWTRDGATPTELAFAESSERAARRTRRLRLGLLAAAFAAVSTGAVVFATQKHAAVARLATSLEARGRLAVLGGDSLRGLVYLAEARKLGATGQLLDLLTNRAIAELDASAVVPAEQAVGVPLGAERNPRREVLYDPANDARAWTDAERARRFAALDPAWAAIRDGATILTVDEDMGVSAFDRDGNRRWHVANAHPALKTTLRDPVAAIAGATGYTAAGDPQLWDLATGTRRATLAVSAPATQGAFSPDATRIATADDRGVVQVWSVATGGLIATCAPLGARIGPLVFAKAGVIAGGANGAIALCDPATGATLRTFNGHQQRISQLAASGSYLASASGDGALRLWDLATGAMVAQPVSLVGSIGALAFSPDDKLLAVGGMANAVQLYDVATGAQVATLIGDETTAHLWWSADGTQVTSFGFGGTVRHWNVAREVRGRVVQLAIGEPEDFELAGGRIRAYGPGGAIDADATTLAIAPGAPAIGRDTRLGRLTVDADGTMHLPGGRALALPFAPMRVAIAGRYAIALASWGIEFPAQVVDLERGEIVARLQGQYAPHAIAIGPDELALSDQDAIVTFSLAALAPRARLLGHHAVISLGYLPDGRLLSGGIDQRVFVWKDGALLASLGDVGGGVTAITGAPDGQTFATASYDGALRVWDAATYEPFFVQTASRGEARFVAYDGDAVVVLGEDGRLARWNLLRQPTPPALLERTLRCRVPYRLDGDVLVPRQLEACP